MFKIVNINKIYFLKLYLDGFKKLSQKWKKLNKTLVEFKFNKTTQTSIWKLITYNKKVYYLNKPEQLEIF